LQLQNSIVRELKEQGFDVGVSTGVATYYTAPDSVGEMLDTADRLMYEAKRAGKGALRQVVLPAANDGAHKDAAPTRTA
jgi:PleD family two-component response regulator